MQRNYTNQGELENISEAGQPQVYWRAAARNASEQITSEQFGNGVTTTRSYDPELLLRSITTLSGTTPLQCIQYGDDPNQNITSRDMTQNGACSTPVGPNLSASVEKSPADWADRIASWSSSAGNWGITFKYDDIGNLKEQAGAVVPAPPLMDYGYGANGAGVHAVTQITSGCSIFGYVYDPAGNQITATSGRDDSRNPGCGPGATPTKITRQIWFTSFNLPLRIKSPDHDITLKYDELSNRALKQDSSTGNSTTYVNGIFQERVVSGGGKSYLLYLPTDDRIIGECLAAPVKPI